MLTLSLPLFHTRIHSALFSPVFLFLLSAFCLSTPPESTPSYWPVQDEVDPPEPASADRKDAPLLEPLAGVKGAEGAAVGTEMIAPMIGRATRGQQGQKKFVVVAFWPLFLLSFVCLFFITLTTFMS